MPLIQDQRQLELWTEDPPQDATDFARFRFKSADDPASARLGRPSMLDPGFANRRPMSILVADDNAINRKVIRTILKKLGYRCIEVTNGEEALEAHTAHLFDTIFMDIDMPEMDGIEASQAIRALETDSQESGAGRRAEIIAVTANVGDETRKRCRSAGMSGFLEKPITVDVVRRQLLRSWPRVRSQQSRAAPKPLEFDWD